jgi:hypothetical protein
MGKQHCTSEYHRYDNIRIDTFTTGVGIGIFSNPSVFTSPPLTQAEYTARQQEYGQAAADYNIFGATKKTDYLQKKKLLIASTDLLKDYVDTVADGNESLIILAGFVPSVSTAQKNTPLEKIVFFTTKHTAVSGEIVVEIPAVINRGDVSYLAVCSEGHPLNNPVMTGGQLKFDATDVTVRSDANKPRKKTFRGLTPGVVYYFYVYASNTVSVAPLSDARPFMAI